MGRTLDKRPTEDEALKIVLEGNERFVSGRLEHSKHRLESGHLLAKGQKLINTVLTVPIAESTPVDVFDLGLGDLYVGLADRNL